MVAVYHNQLSSYHPFTPNLSSAALPQTMASPAAHGQRSASGPRLPPSSTHPTGLKLQVELPKLSAAGLHGEQVLTGVRGAGQIQRRAGGRARRQRGAASAVFTWVLGRQMQRVRTERI